MKVKQIQIFNLPNSPLDAGMMTRVLNNMSNETKIKVWSALIFNSRIEREKPADFATRDGFAFFLSLVDLPKTAVHS